jgi:hypothetical protein
MSRYGCGLNISCICREKSVFSLEERLVQTINLLTNVVNSGKL